MTNTPSQVGSTCDNISINISGSTEEVHILCNTAVALSAIYSGTLVARSIEDAIRKAFGDTERDDQEVREIETRPLPVLLRCITDARFLQVIEDYESGKIEELLQKELLDIGIQTKGLKVKIENWEEVKEKKTTVEKRRSYLTEAMTQDEEKTIKNPDERNSSMKKNQGVKRDDKSNRKGLELERQFGINDGAQGFQIRESIGRNRNNPVTMEQRKREVREPRSCLPDKLSTFTARKAEIQKVIAFLKDDKLAVVSLYGGPGFGKTAIAIEVSHKLSEDLRIPVVFTQLSTANTVDEMVLRVCRDVGVNYEDDPMSALIFWLRNIDGKVIFVMDDIDNLLEEKASFYEFVCLLRKNSNQHCQIVTTSRTSFEIPKLHNNKVQIDVMDGEACVQLLKNQCPQQDDKFLRKLAELCGNIPLAMCIAGSRVRDFKNSDELLQHLEEQPMQTLECPESDQYVNRAINMSYEKCSKEEQQTIIRLSVFEGSFSEDAVRDVIEKKNLDTTRILKKLVSRSLIKQTSQLRYSIHLLIKHFLNNKQESGDERAQKAGGEAVRAKVLMVEHYLELGHQHTMESYSKDGYKDNREALKREALNIQNVLKICCQQEDQTSTDISDCLVNSKIYTTSARFFSLIVRTIIPEPVVDEFLRQCTKLAKERKQHAIKINFDCLLADQARTKSIGRSDEQFILYMKEIKREFETYYEDLKDDKSLCGHFYYLYGRYLLRKSESHGDRERSDLQIEAEKQLEKSLELRKSLTGSEGKADNVFSLLHLGNVCKKIFGTARFLKKGVKANASLKEAKRYYEEAIQLSEENLGEHELTSSCYKPLGDLYLTDDKPDLAEKMYTTAKNMRENLGLDASERYVFLLNNLAECLKKNGRINEAIEVLEKARDTAEKLAQGDKSPVCQTRVYASLAIGYDSVRKNSDAVTYARKALKFEQAIIKTNRYKLKKILEGAD